MHRHLRLLGDFPISMCIFYYFRAGYKLASARIIGYYLACMKNFTVHFGWSPAQMGDDEIRDYLYYLIKNKKASQSLINQNYSALSLKYGDLLSRIWHTAKPWVKRVYSTWTKRLKSFKITDNYLTWVFGMIHAPCSVWCGTSCQLESIIVSINYLKLFERRIRALLAEPTFRKMRGKTARVTPRD